MVSIDHRRGRAFKPGDLHAILQATWDLMPQARGYVEAVHRLNDLGALVTYVWRETSTDRFDAEFREISLSMFHDDRINRCELFDEADLDTALARFDELSRS